MLLILIRDFEIEFVVPVVVGNLTQGYYHTCRTSDYDHVVVAFSAMLRYVANACNGYCPRFRVDFVVFANKVDAKYNCEEDT